eukprot:scaffold57776_cov18-Tisochrysis_lutea.AAC.3
MLGFDRKSEASMHLEILGWALMRHQLSEPPAHNTDCTDMSMCMPNLSCVLEGARLLPMHFNAEAHALPELHMPYTPYVKAMHCNARSQARLLPMYF